MTKKIPKLRLVDYDPKKHEPQNIHDRLNDLFFMLSILNKAEQLNETITHGELIKTLFITKIEISENKKINFFNTGFYPYNHGPFNRSFYTYLQELEESGLVQKNGNDYSLTTKGLDETQILVDEAMTNSNYKILDKQIEENLLEVTKSGFGKIVHELHESRVIINDDGKSVKMGDIIKNKDDYKNKYLENINESTIELKLPNRVVNRLFKIEASIEEDCNTIATLTTVKKMLRV